MFFLFLYDICDVLWSYYSSSKAQTWLTMYRSNFLIFKLCRLCVEKKVPPDIDHCDSDVECLYLGCFLLFFFFFF